MEDIMTGKSIWLTLVIFLSAAALTGICAAAELDVGAVEVQAPNGNTVKGSAIFTDEVLELERVEGDPVRVRFDRIHRLVFKEVTHVERPKLTLRVAVYQLERVGGGSGIEGFVRASRSVIFKVKTKDRVKQYEIGPGNPVREVVFTGNMNKVEKGLDSKQGPKDHTLNRASKEYTIVVPATTRWLQTGIHLEKDQRIHITATGTIKWASDRVGREVGPDGQPWSGWTGRPLPGKNIGMLIARFRPMHRNPYVVGTEKSLITPAKTELELGINDEKLEDNTGNFRVRIVVDPI
jgi:hypothetical protein